MPTTVLENIRGSELPAAWQKIIKATPDKKYSISIRPQQEREKYIEVVKEMRTEAKENGMTPEILADILGVDIKEIS